MPQTILPQTPAPGAPQDAQGARSSSPGRDSGAGESRFDEVSRAEAQATTPPASPASVYVLVL